MKRLTSLFAGALLALALAVPVGAAPPVEATATLTIDDATPVWGQFVTLTADANVTGTYIYMECDHAGGTSFSRSVNDYTAEPYSDDVGLYAPNWPDHAAAVCVADVRLVFPKGNNPKNAIIGDPLAFSVSP